MASDNGLVTAYAQDGEGGGKSLNWNEVHSWDNDSEFLWVHLDLTHPHA